MKESIRKAISGALALLTVLACLTALPTVASAANASNENGLRTAVKKDGTVKLTKNIVLTDLLRIPEGVTVKLDLNGKTLDRGLTECQDLGSVIRVEPGATLTVTDSSGNDTGLITGGASWNGGGICNHGTLTVEGGTIAGNKSLHSTHGGGGGIYNACFEGSTATLTLKGGVIRDNVARNGGGVCNSFGATLILDRGIVEKLEAGQKVKVPTDVTVTQNTAVNGGGIYSAGIMSITGAPALAGNTGGDDLNLAYGKKFTCGALSITAPFGLSVNEQNAVVTEGYGANNQADPKQFFFPFAEEATVQLTSAKNGEVRLKTDSKTVLEVYEQGVITKVEEFDSPMDAWNSAVSNSQPCWYHFNYPQMRTAAEALRDEKYPKYYGGDHWSGWYDELRYQGGILDGSTTPPINVNTFLDLDKIVTDPYIRKGYDVWDGYLQDDHQVKLILGSNWEFDTRFQVERFRNVVIDLNGHYMKRTRNGKKTKSGNLFYLNDFAKLTVIDSKPNVKGYDGFRGGVITGGAGDDCGGGFILNDYAELNLLGGTVYNCFTDEHGGAIYCNDPRAVVNLKNCAFDTCKTLESGDDCNGGAIYLRHTMRVTMENVRFTNCYSEDNGGAIYLANRPGVVKMKNVTFSGNSALDYGGAMAIGDIDDGKRFELEAVNCTFTRNTSGKDGGAVCVSDNDDSVYGSPIIFRECAFTYNTSSRDGAAFELDDNSVVLIDSTVTKNTAKGKAAIYVNDARSLNVGGKTIIKDNTGMDVLLDKDGENTRIYSTGLTDGAYIVVDTDSGDSSTLVMKEVDKRQAQYFHAGSGRTLSFTKTGTREAALTMASLFGRGSVLVLLGIVAAALIAAALILRKKRRETAE